MLCLQVFLHFLQGRRIAASEGTRQRSHEGAGVLHQDADARAIATNGDAHRSAARRVLDRVPEQIRQRAPEELPRPFSRHRLTRPDDGDGHGGDGDGLASGFS